MAFRDHLVRGGAVAALRPLDGPRKEGRKETGPVGQPEGVAQSGRGEPRQRRTQPGGGAGGGGRSRETPFAPVGGVLAQPFAIVGERAGGQHIVPLEEQDGRSLLADEIGRASCRERV